VAAAAAAGARRRGLVAAGANVALQEAEAADLGDDGGAAEARTEGVSDVGGGEILLQIKPQRPRLPLRRPG
jgi:hypothetical protein